MLGMRDRVKDEFTPAFFKVKYETIKYKGVNIKNNERTNNNQ